MDEPGPAVRRRQLGRQLRQLRLDAGIATMEEAAKRSGLSRATVSRIESAKQAILPRTVRLLCQTYGIGAPLIDHLAKQAAESEDRGWLVAYSDTVPNWFERFLGEEAEASEIWTYPGEFIPGLLQTEDYCRAVSVAAFPDASVDEIERRVRVRMTRQRLLAGDNPPRLSAVVNEAAIRRVVGSSQLMAEQLLHLTTVAASSDATIQVLPFAAGAHPAMTCAFTMLYFTVGLGDPTVFVEVNSGAIYPDRPVDVDRYAWTFNRLRELSLSPSDSAALISMVASEL